MKKNSRRVIIGASVGVLAGAIAGILMAPKAGKKTREDIANYVHEMKDKIADELTKAGDVTQETYSEIVDKIVKAYEFGKKITAKDAGDIKKDLDDNYDKIIKTIRAEKAEEVEKAAEK